MEELKRIEGESELGYMARLYRSKLELGLSAMEINDIINLELNSNYAPSTTRCNSANYNVGWSEAIDKYANENTNSDESNYLNELKEKKQEIQELKIQYSDQKREYMSLVRPEARFKRMLEVLNDKLDEVNKKVPFTYNPNNISIINNSNEAVLIASDWHIDSVFNHYFGEYNLEIAKERIQELLEKTIEYCNANNVTTLHLEILGDMISGGIHWSSKVNSEEDCVSQTMTLCEILTSFINELCNNISNVKVYSVIGNHSRINMNKKDNQNGENLERFIPFYLKSRLINIPNVEIMEKCNIDDGIIVFDVLNTKIVGVHGDLDRPTQIVDNMIKMLKVIPNEFHMGHLHHHYEKEEYDIEVLINGSLQGTDYYAKDIRKSGRPMQKLMIYDEKGKLCTYKIKL